MTDHLLLVCSGSIKSWLFPEVKSTFCGTHILPGANVFGHFLFFYFLFLVDPFILAYTVHFMTPLLIFQIHFFLFLKHVFELMILPVVIFLLYSDMASKFIRYNIMFFGFEYWPLIKHNIFRGINVSQIYYF